MVRGSGVPRVDTLTHSPLKLLFEYNLSRGWKRDVLVLQEALQGFSDIFTGEADQKTEVGDHTPVPSGEYP